MQRCCKSAYPKNIFDCMYSMIGRICVNKSPPFSAYVAIGLGS
jgi:hypothetical protein